LISELENIAVQYSVRVIITMRPNTYWRIFEADGGLQKIPHPFTIEILPPQPRTYLNEKKNLYIDELKKLPVRLSGESVTAIISEPEKIFNNMANIMLNDRVTPFINALIANDLRKLSRLLLTYFNTGYLKKHGLANEFTSQAIDPKDDDSLPLWVAYDSIITNNHTTHFSSKKSSAESHLLNVFCNGGHEYNTYLIRLHILSNIYKIKHGTAEKQRKSYKSLFSVENNEELDSSLNHVYRKFINYGLIKASEYFYLNTDEEAGKLSNIEITNCGTYYITEMTFLYNYIIYMKDDVDYPESCAGKIKNCIETEFLKDRFKELEKFLYFLLCQEKTFLHYLNKDRLKKYSKEFALSENNLLFSKLIIDRIIQYAESKTRGVDLERLKKIAKHAHFINGLFVSRICGK
jgi:hypothetical protein